MDRVTARDRDAEPPSGTSAERGWYPRSPGKDNIDSAESAQRRQRVAHISDGPAPKGAQRPISAILYACTTRIRAHSWRSTTAGFRRQLHRAREKPVEWTPQQVKAFRWMVTAQSPGRIGTKIYSPRTQRCGLRSQPDWLRRGRARRVVGDSRRGASQCRNAHPQKPVSRSRRVAGLRKTSGAVRKMQSGRKMSRASLPNAGRDGSGSPVRHRTR